MILSWKLAYSPIQFVLDIDPAIGHCPNDCFHQTREPTVRRQERDESASNGDYAGIPFLALQSWRSHRQSSHVNWEYHVFLKHIATKIGTKFGKKKCKKSSKIGQHTSTKSSKIDKRSITYSKQRKHTTSKKRQKSKIAVCSKTICLKTRAIRIADMLNPGGAILGLLGLCCMWVRAWGDAWNRSSKS